MSIRLSRRKIAGYAAKQLAANADNKQIVAQLAAFLVDTKRTNELGLLIRDIEYELSKLGIVLAEITSVFDLTEATRQSITEFIKVKTGAHQVYLRQFLDPDILGGVKIDLPGLRLDTTITRRLTKLRTNYKK